MTRYLTTAELIIINEEIIGARTQLRDVDLLESAIIRPQSSAFGEDAYPTMPDKAAALFHSLARNHAFVDGNKRTATVATIIFLEHNGYQMDWNNEEALQFIVMSATGGHDVTQIAQWIRDHITESSQS